MQFSPRIPSHTGILITGFSPFSSFRSNPSAIIAQQLETDNSLEYNLIVHILPVAYSACEQFVESRYNWTDLSHIIMLGLNARAKCLMIERIAINMEHSATPDERADRACSRPINSHGPDGIFSNWPVDRLQLGLMESGFPGAVSNSAGTFVCNSLFYRVLHRISSLEPPHPSVGFIHLPLVSRHWPVRRMRAGVRQLIQLLLEPKLESSL